MASKVSRSTVATVGYLLLDTAPAALALPAASVLGLIRATEWTAEPPLPLGALVPIHFAAPEPAWVLRIGSIAQSIIARISGKVHVEYLQSDALLPMPTLNGFELFSKVVLADGRPSALVVNIDAILRLHRELGN